MRFDARTPDPAQRLTEPVSLSPDYNVARMTLALFGYLPTVLGSCRYTGARIGGRARPTAQSSVHKERRRKIMSANHPNRLGLFGTLAVAVLAIGLATPAFAQRGSSASRAGTAEFGLTLMDFPGTHSDGVHGASLDVDGDLAWGLTGGYHFTDKFQLGGNISWANPDYRLKLVPDSGSPWPTVNANMDISTFILTGTFNFFDGPLTPYAQIGAGWVHVDSNVVNGTPSTGCWW